MPRDPREWQAELDLQTQLSRAQGSLEIESTFAVLNKLQGRGGAVQGEGLGNYLSKSSPITIPLSPPGVDIDWNIRRALVSVSQVWFIEHLAPKGEMDYKLLGRNRLYEDFGNFNYGAVALAFGLSENAALRAAGLLQTIVNTQNKLKKSDFSDAAIHGVRHSIDFLGSPPYGDQKRDQEMIKNGFRYFREVFLKKFSTGDMLRDIDTIREDVEKEEWESNRRIPSRIREIIQ